MTSGLLALTERGKREWKEKKEERMKEVMEGKSAKNRGRKKTSKRLGMRGVPKR